MTVQENTQLALISDNLQTMLESKAGALPSNFNKTRFMQNCLTVLSEVKEIYKYEPKSVAITMLKGAFLGLDFFNRECYAIPYGNVLNFQSDYRGEIKVCKRWSPKPIDNIYAKVVREGDGFESFIREGRQFINFNPLNFNDNPVVGVFAVVYFKDGSMAYDNMSLKEVEHIRKSYSKAPNSPSWTKSTNEMYKKVVLRRLCKMIDLDFDNADQRSAFDEGSDIEIKKSNSTIDVKHNVVDPFPIDKEFSVEVKEEAFTSSNPEKFAEFKEVFPNEEDWKIEARVRELNEIN